MQHKTNTHKKPHIFINFCTFVSKWYSLFLSILLVIVSILLANQNNHNELQSQIILENQSLIKEQQQTIDATNHYAESLEEIISNYRETVHKLQQERDELALELGYKEVEVQNYQHEMEELIEVLANTINYPDKDYIIAQAVWNRLKSWGLNDHVAAGIIGNIMVEVAGNTLDFSRWRVYSRKNTYGLCQWLGTRRERLLNDFGGTITDQLNFLYVELYEVIRPDNEFYMMTDECEAALYFAKVFERCGKGSYEARQRNATVALKYFTGR